MAAAGARDEGAPAAGRRETGAPGIGAVWAVWFVLLQAMPYTLVNPYAGPGALGCYAWVAAGLLIGAWGALLIPSHGGTGGAATRSSAGRAAGVACAVGFGVTVALAVLEIVGFAITLHAGPEAAIATFGPVPASGWPGLRPVLQVIEKPLLLASGLLCAVAFVRGVFHVKHLFGIKGATGESACDAEVGSEPSVARSSGAAASAARMFHVKHLFPYWPDTSSHLARVAILASLALGTFALRAAAAAGLGGRALSGWSFTGDASVGEPLGSWWQAPLLATLALAVGWALVATALVVFRRHLAAPDAAALLSAVALGALSWNAVTRITLVGAHAAGAAALAAGVSALAALGAAILLRRRARGAACDDVRASAEDACVTRAAAFLDGLAAERGCSLAERERDCAALMLAGLTSGDAADRLTLSASTVRSYQQRAYRKLGVADASELRRLFSGPAALGAGEPVPDAPYAAPARADVASGAGAGVAPAAVTPVRGVAPIGSRRDAVVLALSGALCLILMMPWSVPLPWRAADALILGLGLVLLTGGTAAVVLRPRQDAAARRAWPDGDAAPRLSVGDPASPHPHPLASYATPWRALVPALAFSAFALQAAWSIPAVLGGVLVNALAAAVALGTAALLARRCGRPAAALVVAAAAIVLVAVGEPRALSALAVIAVVELSLVLAGRNEDASSLASADASAQVPAAGRGEREGIVPNRDARPVLATAALVAGAALFLGAIASHAYTDVFLMNDTAAARLGGVPVVWAAFCAVMLAFGAVALAGLFAVGRWLRPVDPQAAEALRPVPACERARLYLIGRGLTELQAAIVLETAAGLPSSQIAARLHCSPGTVNAARWSAYRTLGVTDRTALVRHLADMTTRTPR
ncbi:MAG: helix-turn-helix transcriptional regulator [Eggerthellaceae bacterium]|nr:helix-turn-helix transcriptional regulator [Eggerthellaceae bacterium]